MLRRSGRLAGHLVGAWVESAENEIVKEPHLDKKDGWDAEGELLVLGLVAEKVHPKECSDAASNYSQPNESFFRDAPLPSPGLPFVDAIKEEGQDVNKYKVDGKVLEVSEFHS